MPCHCLPSAREKGGRLNEGVIRPSDVTTRRPTRTHVADEVPSESRETTMSRSKRPPGSREEDAWLSNQQLARCAPAETEPFQSPVPTRMVSNGEYMPHPQTRQQQHVEHRIKELADMA